MITRNAVCMLRNFAPFYIFYLFSQAQEQLSVAFVVEVLYGRGKELKSTKHCYSVANMN